MSFKSYTLLATLGRSPGVITGLYYTLLDEHPNLNITRLCILRTADRDVTRAYELIKQSFEEAQVKIEISDVALRQEDHVSAAAFHKIVVDSIEQNLGQGDIVAGITGGRTSMGAILATVAQLYPEISSIYHLHVNADLERDGDIDQLVRLRGYNDERYLEVMRPPQHKRKLVRLYNLGLVQQSLIERRAYVEATPTLDLEETEETELLLNLLPRRLNHEQARAFGKIRADVQRGETLDENGLIDLLDEAGITGAKDVVHDLIDASETHKSPEDMMNDWVRSVERRNEYWARGFGNIRNMAASPMTTTGMMFITMALQGLSVYLQITTQ